MASSDSSNKPHAFNPAEVATPPETYKQVAISPILPTSKLITVAGQTGIDPGTGKVTSNDIKQQSQQAYQNIANCLKAAGASPRDIVFVRHYIVKETGDAKVDSVEVVERGWGPHWIDFMDREADGHRPPDTVVGVASLAKAELLYECEVWAMIQD